jgi:diguanylate cyclase (GGDEF)-like protein
VEATTGAAAGVVAWNASASLALLAAVAIGVGALRTSADFVRTVSGTDHLTGILDSLSFRELVELERSRALRYNRPFTLAYLDVDRLRRVNELRGHLTGDRTLQLIASILRQNIRSMDSVARLGGDEFGLLMPETGKGAAEVALAKVRSCLAEAMRTRELPLTFSVGAVICVGAPESVDRLIQRADGLMYRVKDGGGDGMAAEVLDDPFGIEAILQRS